jgi:hypothetical protein
MARESRIKKHDDVLERNHSGCACVLSGKKKLNSFHHAKYHLCTQNIRIKTPILMLFLESSRLHIAPSHSCSFRAPDIALEGGFFFFGKSPRRWFLFIPARYAPVVCSWRGIGRLFLMLYSVPVSPRVVFCF